MAIDVAELLNPIAGSDPCGEDLSFADVFDQMREARRADDASLSQGDWQTDRKVADWRLVLQLGERVLSRQSKDLQAAVWVGEAAIGKEGYAGAAEAFALLGGLLERYWEGLYPRLDGDDADERISKLSWFNTYASRVLRAAPLTEAKPAMTLNDWQASRDVDNLGRQNAEAYQAALAEGKPTGEGFDKALVGNSADFIKALLASTEAAQASFAAFKTQVDQKLGRSAPSLSEIEEALKRAQQLVLKAAKAKGLVAESTPVAGDEPVAHAAPAGAVGAAVAVSAPGGVGFSLQLGGAHSGRDGALKALGEIAQFFRRTEPHSPVPFLIERAISWADTPLDEWLVQVVTDDSVLSRIRDRTGIAQ